MTLTLATAAIAASIAASTHVYMFLVESVLYDRTSTRQMLEIPAAHAAAIRLWAYHQGIYNLLLGATSAAGAIALFLGSIVSGSTLLLAACTAMVVAALALIGLDRRRRRVPGFVAQAAPALICVIALVA